MLVKGLQNCLFNCQLYQIFAMNLPNKYNSFPHISVKFNFSLYMFYLADTTKVKIFVCKPERRTCQPQLYAEP